jgi:sterol desaturase/sphingolipid hydroxylase (fatty acid hydroxylase superfamily)
MNAVEVGDEATIRLLVFLLLFTAFAVSERSFPRRVRKIDWRVRWLNNLLLSSLNTVLLRIFMPFSGTLFAVYLFEGQGALLRLTDLHWALSVGLFVVLFDLTIYFQHRLFHWVHPLWVLHRVHHTDLDIDVTTGSRFHPISILISMLIKLALIFVLGPFPIAVLVAEVLLNGTSMFNHSNIRLPASVDRALRWFIVTPDMHRIHHSVIDSEHGCNFGFNFSCWDRLFGTYLGQAALPQEHMVIGISPFDESNSVRLDRLLFQPFKRRPSGS